MCSITENCSQNNDQEKEKCAICLGDVFILTTLSSCEHTFCYSCILNWSHVRKTCPVCRKDFINFVCFVPPDLNVEFPTECTVVYNEASVSVIFPEQNIKNDEYSDSGGFLTDEDERGFYRTFYDSDDGEEAFEEETFEALHIEAYSEEEISASDDETYTEAELEASESSNETYSEPEASESNEETYSEAEASNEESYSEAEASRSDDDADDDEVYSEFGEFEMTPPATDEVSIAESDFGEPQSDDEESIVDFASNDSYYEPDYESSEVSNGDSAVTSDGEMSMDYIVDEDDIDWAMNDEETSDEEWN